MLGEWSGDWSGGPDPLRSPFNSLPGHRQVGPRETRRPARGRERTARAIRGHANLAQIWAGFASFRTPRPSAFAVRPRVGPRFCPARPKRTRGRGLGRAVGDALIYLAPLEMDVHGVAC